MEDIFSESENDQSFNEDMATMNKPKRGRPAGKKVVVTRQEFIGDDKPTGAMQSFTNLFDDGESDGEMPVRVRVTRKDPDEGMLGYIEDMDSTEQTIIDRWGGGSVYRLDGLNSRGRMVRVKTLRLAGEPIFMSEVAENQWRKSRGLPAKNQGFNGPAPGQLSSAEVLKLLDEREEKRAKQDESRRIEERERADERRREERDADEKRRQADREWKGEQDRLQREWDEKRRREDDAMAVRRRQEEQDNETKRLALTTAQQSQQQQFMQMMLQMTQSQSNQTIAFMRETAGGAKSDPTDALMKGVQLVMQIKESVGGGEASPDDLLTTVVKNLPSMLNGIGNAAGQVVREFKGNKAEGESSTVPALGPSGSLTLPPGQVSAKFTEIINRIAKNGGDPEQALNQVADRLLSSKKTPKAPAQDNATPASPAFIASLPVVGGPGYVPPSPVAPAPVESSVTRLAFKKTASE